MQTQRSQRHLVGLLVPSSDPQIKVAFLVAIQAMEATRAKRIRSSLGTAASACFTTKVCEDFCLLHRFKLSEVVERNTGCDSHSAMNSQVTSAGISEMLTGRVFRFIKSLPASNSSV